jgi:transcriptional regulator with XRE-family HTH domain
VDPQLQVLGRRIKELRSERGWSQEEFAEVCGVHRTYMGHIERGEKNLSFGSLVRVANALGISLSELFKGLEDDESRSPTKGRPDRPRNPGASALDRDRLIREVATLERVLRGLREIVSTPGRKRKA